MLKLENSRRTWSWIWGTRAKPFSTKNQDITQILPCTRPRQCRALTVIHSSPAPATCGDPGHVTRAAANKDVITLISHRWPDERIAVVKHFYSFTFNTFYSSILGTSISKIYLCRFLVGGIHERIGYVETIIHFFNTRIYSRLDWSPCLQINVMQVERKENAGIMKYGIRDSWSTQEQRQSFDCDIIDMLHISCFHISVAAAARCRCRRVTPRRTFSHQNIQGQCLLPASITFVADTVARQLVTHMTVRSH